MRWRVVHRTEYRYGRTVSAGHTVARLRPRPLPHRQVHAAETVVEPEPSSGREHVDGFGNAVAYLVVDEPHDHLVVTGCSDVELTPPEDGRLPQLDGLRGRGRRAPPPGRRG